jgi:hypothetical protein
MLSHYGRSNEVRKATVTARKKQRGIVQQARGILGNRQLKDETKTLQHQEPIPDSAATADYNLKAVENNEAPSGEYYSPRNRRFPWGPVSF